MRMFFFLPRKVSQWLTILVSIIAASCVTFFLIAFVSSFAQTSVMFRTANAWQMRNSLVYSTPVEFNVSQEEKHEELNRILSTDGVLDANNVSMYVLDDPSIDASIRIECICYSDTLLKDIRYKLSEGSYSSMDKNNQVILPSQCRKFLTVGDTLTGRLTDELSYGWSYAQNPTHAIPVPVTVTVAGFLAEQPSLDPFNAQSLDGLFSSNTDYYDAGYEVRFGVASNICNTAGAVIPATRTDLFLVRTNGSVPPAAVKKKLSSVVMSPGLLHTGNELIDEYIDANKTEIGETLSLGITAAVLAFSILISSTLLELVYRRKEMGSLYLCGAPWSKCVWTVLAVYIVPFVIGFPIGLFLFAKSGEWHLFYLLKPELKVSDVLITLGLEAFFLACAILPFRFSTKFKTPYELFRKD